MRTALLYLAVCLSLLAMTLPTPASAQAGKGAARPAPKGGPSPDPKLSPQRVVSIVLNALQHNDAKDSGIVTTFHFASPSNQRATGPLPRFIRLVKNPMYLPMINFKSAAQGPIHVNRDHAWEEVTVTSAKGDKTTYLFGLSRQKALPFKGCWMTDSVMRAPRPAPPSAKTSRFSDGLSPTRKEEGSPAVRACDMNGHACAQSGYVTANAT